jgi:hypothetical protein
VNELLLACATGLLVLFLLALAMLLIGYGAGVDGPD